MLQGGKCCHTVGVLVRLSYDITTFYPLVSLAAETHCLLVLCINCCRSSLSLIMSWFLHLFISIGCIEWLLEEVKVLISRILNVPSLPIET